MPAGDRFELATAGRIVFGPGSQAQVGALARGFGRRALFVTGRDPGRAPGVLASLESAGVEHDLVTVAGEPTVDLVRRASRDARSRDRQLVVAVGGGSALDTGKALAALVPNPGDPLDYLEVVGRGQPLERPPLPFIALPATAGTGSEVTRNAVLTSTEHHVKVSLRSPLMLPDVALVDPDLLKGLPRAVVAGSGLDALAQLIEPYVSVRAQPITDALCQAGMARSARSLRRAWTGDMGPEVREDLAFASLCGGLALANAGLGAVHGFAAPIGGMFPAPHGPVCAALLPHVMRANVEALRERDPQGSGLERYAEVARILTGRPAASLHDGIAWVADLCAALETPGLARYGVTAADVPVLVAKARSASSMRGNPISLDEPELAQVLLSAL
jgi:alcohol dehydrogenase class IV